MGSGQSSDPAGDEEAGRRGEAAGHPRRNRPEPVAAVRSHGHRGGGFRGHRAFGRPDRRVLQFAFGGDATNDHLPHNHTRDSVVYTGTHDNDTTTGWFKGLPDQEREYCLEYLASDGDEVNWDLIRAAMASVADVAIIPLQDVLGLGNEARMNLPASESGNWSWRMKRDALTDEMALRLKELGRLYGRES